jgi:hypothetical protein
MPVTWIAPLNVLELLETIKEKYHHPRLQAASLSVVFNESKPFTKDRFNWGSVCKFSVFNKLFQDLKYDFCISICSDVWHSILNAEQKEALLDLHLTRCEVEYIPETIIEGKKKIVVKDEWGRVKYTNDIKFDEDGNPKWQVAPLDLNVFSRNVERYGLWCTELNDFKSVLTTATGGENEI